MFPANRNRWVTFDCYGTLVDPQSPTRPLKDVELLLAELRLRGYKLGVLTNCNDAQFEAAHRVFSKPFDLFVTAERIRARKPDLWHFRAFQLMTQVQKDDWVHIASDWQHDIVPAEVFGIQRVWLDRRAAGEDPSLTAQPRRSLRGGGAHVRSAAEAVRAVDWLFQDRAAVCAS